MELDKAVKVPGRELREIAAGVRRDLDRPILRDESIVEDVPERPICGFEAFNEQDGENYRCELPAHGQKVKHGNWRKL